MIEKKAEALLPTKHGEFRIIAFTAENNGHEYAVLVKGEVQEKENILVRVHSGCITGDVFSSLNCDCHEQLAKSMELIEKAGNGILIYDKEQEGRGIGFVNKIIAYKLKQNGLDTVESAHKLGFAGDLRTYKTSAEILKQLGVKSIALLTNNPDKIKQLEKFGITVSERVPLIIPPNGHNKKYLETKKAKMGHLF